jgi:hypothetical protein
VHDFDRTCECIAIAKSAESDSGKTSRLTALLRGENNSLLECFRGEVQWHGHGPEAHFEGAPNWRVVIAKLESFSEHLSRELIDKEQSGGCENPHETFQIFFDIAFEGHLLSPAELSRCSAVSKSWTQTVNTASEIMTDRDSLWVTRDDIRAHDDVEWKIQCFNNRTGFYFLFPRRDTK